MFTIRLLKDFESFLGLLFGQGDCRLHGHRVFRLPVVHLALGHVSSRLILQLVDEVAITGVLVAAAIVVERVLLLLELEARVDQPGGVDGASACNCTSSVD